jgi:hypothetical protein
MRHPLRPEVLTPSHTYALRLAAVGLGAALMAAGLLRAVAPVPQPAPVPPPPVEMTESVTMVPIAVVVMTEPVPPALRPAALVFRAGGVAYMKLADLDGVVTNDDPAAVAALEPMPRHGKATRVADDFVDGAVAPVADKHVGAAHRAWMNREVIVDGTCHAKVTGFAVIARLIGDPGYAGEEGTDAWTARTIMEHGAPVLAARLDGCADKAFAIARDATMSPSIALTKHEDAPLAAAAKQQVLTSPEAVAAAKEWATYEMPGAWARDPETTWTVDVLRHPTTGATFVAVHAVHEGGCGGPQINVWHLYRADADGKLTRLPSSIGGLTTIEQITDVDGDGTLELIGSPWLGEQRVMIRATGERIDHLPLQFYGCGC